MSVVAVDAHGIAVEENYIVRRFLVTRGTNEREPIPEGAVIRVRRSHADGSGGDLSWQPGQLTSADAAVFRTAVRSSLPPVTDDVLWGTAEPQVVGGIWPIDTARVADYFKRMNDLTIPEGGLAGAAKVQALDEVRGVECLRVRLDVRVDEARLTDESDEAKFDFAGGRITIRGAYPTDTDLGVMEYDETMNVAVRAISADHRDAVVEVTVESTRHEEFER